MNLFTITGKIALEGVEQSVSDLERVRKAGKNVDIGVTESTKSIKKDVKSAETSLTESFKRIGQVIGSVFAVHKIKQFGMDVVQTSANIQAETAQFEASFGTMSDSATEMFQRVADSTGVLATRLRVTGTKAFSQFKGAGLDANEALAKTETFLNIASDAAAYYDISLEDAEARIRSFVRGNVEAGDAIGLFTSESQRNSYAMEMYGAKWVNLTEAQKQNLMLNVAKDIYDQSGATGQAAREMDGYANVVGNLKEAWRQFKGSLGVDLLSRVIPVLQRLTESMLTWGDKIKYAKEKLKEKREELAKYKDALGTAVALILSFGLALGAFKLIEGAVTLIKKLKDIILILNAVMMDNPTALVIALLVALAGAFIYLWNNNEKFRQKITEVWNSLQGVIQPVIDKLIPILDQLTDWFTRAYDQVIVPFCQDVLAELQNFWNELSLIWDEFVNAIQPIIDVFVLLGDTIWNTITNTILPIINDFFGSFSNGTRQVDEDLTGVQGIFDTVFNFINGILDGFISFLNEKVIPAITAVANFISENVDTIQSCVDGGMKAVQGIIEVITGSIRGDWETAWKGIQNIIDGVWQSITSIVDFAVTAVKKLIHWDDVVETCKTKWGEFSDNIGGAWETAKTKTSNGITAVKNFIHWDDIVETCKSAWGEFQKAIADSWDAIIKFIPEKINAMWEGIKEGFTWVKEKAVGIWDGVTGIFKFDKKDYEEEGANVTEGVAAGIENKAAQAKVEKASTSLGSRIGRWIKRTLRIESPSKVMRDEVGVYISEGIAVGIKDGEYYVADSIDELVEYGIMPITDKATEAIEESKPSILESLMGMFNNVTTNLEPVTEAIKKLLKGDLDGFKELGEAIGKMLGTGIEEGVASTTDNGGTGESGGTDDGGKNVPKETPAWVQKWKDVAKNFEKSKGSFIKTCGAIAEAMNSALSDLDTFITPLYDGIVALQEQRAQNSINAIEKEQKATFEAWDEELNQFKEKVSEEEEILDEQYRKGLLTTNQYNAEKKRLDDQVTKAEKENSKKRELAERELAKKKDDINRKQFEANKKTQLANIWINTATAIMTSFAQMGWVGGLVAMGLLTAQAGIETALINEQQYESALAEGGIVDKPTRALVGEDGAEAVVPLENNLGWTQRLAELLFPMIETASFKNIAYGELGVVKEDIYNLRDVIGDKLDNLRDMLDEKLNIIIGKNPQLVLDSGVLVGEIRETIDYNLGEMSRMRSRGN